MLKKIKSLFVIEEDAPAKSKAPEKATSAESRASSAGKPEPPKTEEKRIAEPASSEAMPGKVKEKFLNVLFGAMERNDLEGFDYLEFKQFLKSLDKMQMDEGTKFQSAFATAQTMGASISILKKSAQHYLDILKAEEQKFNQAANNQKEKNLTNKQEEIKLLKAQIEEKTKRIQALQKEIESHRKVVEQRTKEISVARVKVEQTQNDFIASYDALVGQIRSDLKKIDTYLSQPKNN